MVISMDTPLLLFFSSLFLPEKNNILNVAKRVFTSLHVAVCLYKHSVDVCTMYVDSLMKFIYLGGRKN